MTEVISPNRFTQEEYPEKEEEIHPNDPLTPYVGLAFALSSRAYNVGVYPAIDKLTQERNAAKVEIIANGFGHEFFTAITEDPLFQALVEAYKGELPNDIPNKLSPETLITGQLTDLNRIQRRRRKRSRQKSAPITLREPTHYERWRIESLSSTLLAELIAQKTPSVYNNHQFPSADRDNSN